MKSVAEVVTHVRALIEREQRDREAWATFHPNVPTKEASEERDRLFANRIDVLKEVLAYVTEK